MSAPRVLRVAALALALGASGCLSLGGSPVEVREYNLVSGDSIDSARPAAAARTTLEVERFTVDEALDREGIVWRKGLEVGAYSMHRWARLPQRAVRELVAHELALALPTVSVATEPPLADPDLVLRAHVARCEEVDRDETWFGVVELRVTLARHDGVEVLRREYVAEERATSRHPLAVVRALQRALDRTGKELAGDVAAASVPAR